MRLTELPDLKTFHAGISHAAVDLYSFAVVCYSGQEWLAEDLVLDTLFLALENVWFSLSEKGTFSHTEYREECFQKIWQEFQSRGGLSAGVATKELPLGHEEMRFYRLDTQARALLYLKTKKKFDYAALARIFGLEEEEARKSVEHSREYLLGRGLKEVAVEDF